jgi:hypothetical protein
MKFLPVILVILLVACSSNNKELSLDTRYEIGQTPQMSRKELGIFLAGTLKNSDLPVDEKMQIKKQLEVYIAELTTLELSTRRLYAATLKNLGKSKENKNDMTIKELKKTISKLTKEQIEIKFKLLELIINKFDKTVTPEDQEYLLQQIFESPKQQQQIDRVI